MASVALRHIEFLVSWGHWEFMVEHGIQFVLGIKIPEKQREKKTEEKKEEKRVRERKKASKQASKEERKKERGAKKIREGKGNRAH